MAEKNRTTLKTYFETGDTPTEAQFADAIDSDFNLTDDTLDDITEGSTNLHMTSTDKNNLNAANTHATSDGSSHSFIDQDVTSGSSPVFDGSNITGVAIDQSNQKGNILAGDGSSWTAVPIGSNDQILTADSSEAAGVKWATPAGGGDMLASIYDPNTLQTAVYDANNIAGEELGSATYSSVQDFINATMSSGYIDGGAITDNGDGTCATAAMKGYIRGNASSISDLYAFDVDADASVSLTDEALNYVYCDYNNGSPQILSTSDLTTLNHTSNFVIGLVYREGTDLHIANAGQKLNNFIYRNLIHSYEHDGIEIATGLVTTETGTRNLDITAGVLYWALERITIDAFDSSGADTFVYQYRDGGGGWTSVAAQSQIDNTQYDDGSGSLATLTASRYGVHWVYSVIDGDIYVLYGRGDYTLAGAEAATVPTDIPDELANVGILIAKVIIQKSASSFTEIAVPWTSSIGLSGVTDHGALGGLADDDHPQYIKDSEFTQDSGVLVGTGAGTFQEETGATLRTSLGLTIGTNVQAQDQNLQDIADFNTDKGNLISGSGTDYTATQLGTDGQYLKAVSANAGGVGWANPSLGELSDVDAGVNVDKGNLLGGTGTNYTAVTVGSDDQVLTADSTQPAGIKWADASAGGGGGPRGFTYVIAASDSLDNTGVDATCDGTADDVEIQAGIDAVNTAGGGTVMLLDGTYEIDAIVNLKSNVTLKGQGYGTVLTRSDATDFFETANSTTVSNAFVRNLLLDSNEQDAHIYDDNGLLTNSGFIDFWVIDHTASSRIFDWSDTGVSGVIKGGVFENCNKMGSFNGNIFITDCYFNVESPITSSNSTIIYGAGPTTNCVFNVENFTTSISIGIFNFSGNPGTIFSNNKVYGLEGTTTPFYFNTRTVFTNNMIYELSTGSYTGVAFWLSSSNASGSTISGNMAYLASSTGDEILKAGSGANEITISGNYFRAGRGLSISYDNWTVTGNTLYISGLIGVNITGNYTVFSGNTIYAQGSNCRALQMSNADIGNVVTNNSFRGNNTSTIPIYWASDPYMDASSSYILENNSWVYMGGTPQTNGIECYEAKYEIMNNGTGGSSADGQVVVKSLDTSSLTYEFNTTTTAGDPTVVGVCIEVASSDNQARIVTKGPVDNLKVDGTDDIAVGDPLSTFTSAGIAQKAATGETVFAIAMEAYTTDDSNGVINAMVIEPYIMP